MLLFRKQIFIFFLTALFLPVFTAVAQESETVEDLELWTGGTYKLRLNKKLKVELEQQFRFNDTVSSFKSSFSEFGFRYTLNKRFKVKGSYRYTARNNERNRNRITFHLYYSYSKKKFPLAIQLRSGFQNDSEVWTDQQITYVRNRVKLEYVDLKKLTPFVAYESFYRFNYRNEFRINRYTAGLGWKINKRWTSNLFYRIDNEINVKLPERQNILGLMFIYSMKI